MKESDACMPFQMHVELSRVPVGDKAEMGTDFKLKILF